MTPSDLERETHHALRRLPSPRAPRSLTPRVMAAVRARREAPWFARPMTTWPFALQAMTIALAVVPLAALGVWVFGGGVLQSGVTALGLSGSAPWSQLLPPVLRQAMDQASTVLVLWRLLFAPVLVYAAAFAVAVGCVFVVCAAALTWVVLGRVPAQAG
jgi:hypothetical protein